MRSVTLVEAQTPRHLLDHEGLGHVVGAGAPVFLRYPERRQLHRHTVVEALPREPFLLVVFGGTRPDLLVAEAPQHATELGLVIGEIERRHRQSPSS